MTDDTNRTDAVGQSIDDLRRRVKPAEPDALVHRVRAHMDVRARRRRRNVRIVVSAGCAAVVVLAIVAVAGRSTDRGTTHVTRHVLTAGVESGPIVLVEPATGLSDGTTVEVTAHDFDAGTSVTFLECIAAEGAPQVAFAGNQTFDPLWVCLGPTTNDPDSQPSATVGRVTDAGTTAVATFPVSDWIFDFSVWVNAAGMISAGHLPPGEDPPYPACAMATAWMRFDEKSIVARTPCRIVAIGEWQGSTMIVASEPLLFD